MLLDRRRVEINLARKCLSFTSLRKVVSPGVITKIRSGLPITSRSAGKIASALSVDVEDLIMEEK